MDLSVMLHGETVGTCTLEEDGLYWQLQCRCSLCSEKIERLYAGEKNLGVLEKKDGALMLRRRVSKASCPELPPQSGMLALHPIKPKEPAPEAPSPEPWEGTVQGYPLKGFFKDGCAVFPYDENAPCPCEPLLCFFEVRDGYWHLPIKNDCLG